MANKQKNIDLGKLLQESESLVDLERKLNNEGYRFGTIKNYLKFLESEWKNYVEDGIEGKIQEIQKDQKVNNELPALIVTDNSRIEYILHGINHGGQFLFSGGWHVRRNVKEFINEIMDSFHNPKEGEDYFYEENLDIPFDLLKSRGANDHLLGKTAEVEEMIHGMCLAPFTLLALPLIHFMHYLKAARINNPKDIKEAISYFAKNSLHDTRGNIRTNNFLNLIKMPEPLNFEMDYIKEKSSLYSVIHRGPTKTSSERSLFMAQYLKKKAEENKLKKLHFLTGMYHVSEISYFIKNPDYSFEELEDYRKSRL